MRVRGKPAMETGPPLLEREGSLALLNEYAAQAAGGEGRLVLLSGEAGVGKSALVERLCRELPDARWSWSMCDGLFTPRPLGPLFDLADQLGGELLERCRAGADREELFRALLAQIAVPKVTGTAVPRVTGIAVPEATGIAVPEAMGIAVPEATGIAVPGTMDVLVVE